MQEVRFPTRNEVEGGRRPVYTSRARKIGVPLLGRQGRSPSAGLFSLALRGAHECFRGGRCEKERAAEEGAGRRQLDHRLEQGGNFLPQNCVLCGIMSDIMTL